MLIKYNNKPLFFIIIDKTNQLHINYVPEMSVIHNVITLLIIIGFKLLNDFIMIG